MSTQATATVQAPTYEELAARVRMLEANQKRTKGTVFSNGLSIQFNSLGGKDKQGKPNKGNMSIYGLGKFPWSPYLSQVERVIAIVKSGELEAAIEAHRSELSVKPDAE